MWISEFNDYKAFLKAVIATFLKKGRGQARRLAEHLNVAPVVISQVLTQGREFTVDQALKAANFYSFDELTTEYFICLVIRARAETTELRRHYDGKLRNLREEAQKIKNLVDGREELSEPDRAIFYSNWYYSGVRILSSIEGYQSVDKIAEYFGMSKEKVGGIVSFLLKCGLCVNDDGKIKPGARSTHVPADSYFVNNHRNNWRSKAREKLTEPGTNDIFYSSPLSISEADAELVKKQILQFIKDLSKRVVDSPSEKLMCINIDWFKF